MLLKTIAKCLTLWESSFMELFWTLHSWGSISNYMSSSLQSLRVGVNAIITAYNLVYARYLFRALHHMPSAWLAAAVQWLSEAENRCDSWWPRKHSHGCKRAFPSSNCSSAPQTPTLILINRWKKLSQQHCVKLLWKILVSKQGHTFCGWSQLANKAPPSATASNWAFTVDKCCLQKLSLDNTWKWCLSSTQLFCFSMSNSFSFLLLHNCMPRVWVHSHVWQLWCTRLASRPAGDTYALM